MFFAGAHAHDANDRIIPTFSPGDTQVQHWIATRGAELNTDNNSFFLQDHWVATRMLTFDLGVRFEKVKSNLQEVKARDGIVIALTDRDPDELGGVCDEVIEVPAVSPLLQPIVNVIPLQLLAYFTGVRRGADVDQPRNLAKSVTVE